MSESTASSVSGGQTALEADSSSGGLFVRKSSGLVRDIGISGAFGLNLGFLSIGGALGYFAVMLTLFPSGNILFVLLVGGIFVGLLAVPYAQLATSMPRSGGDYVYQSRVFHPILGAWIGVGFLIFLLYTVATGLVFFTSAFLPFIFGTLGETLHASFFTTLASDVTTQTGNLIAVLVVLLVTLGLIAAGVRVASRAAYWFIVAGLISAAVIIGELIFHGSGSFASAFNHASGHPNAYSGVLAKARSLGWKPGTTTSETISETPYAFLIYFGFWYTAFTGGEIKQPARTQNLAMGLAFGFGLVVLVLAWLAMQHAASSSFIQASAYLQANAPAAYEHLSSVSSITPQSYAVLVSGDPVTKSIMAIGYAGWLFPILGILAMSRTMFALSFDRLLPASITRVSGSRHTPVVALAAAGVITAALATLVIYDEGVTQAFKNVIVLGACISLMGCIAAIALPFRRKTLYESAPRMLTRKILGLSTFIWLSAIAGGFCAVVTYLTLTNTTYSSGYTTTSIISLLIMGFGGLAVYAASKLIRGRQGIDISLAMRELPPE